MKDIYVVAHTHWDFEWYFTRQESRVQFAFHMDDVFSALENNELTYYVLDGQMSIIDDYLADFPEKAKLIYQYVTAGRLFIGPWFTQIDEMVTSGEAIIRNLRLGMKEANQLGGTMKIGYLPDSFGQSQDMPKIYNGFGIQYAIFWRGMPKDHTRYFYWSSNDGSKVLTANIKNGYSVGADLIDSDDFFGLVNRITGQTRSKSHLLPVGGDQRSVDFQLKKRIQQGNKVLNSTEINSNQDKAEHDVYGENIQFIESSYPAFFKELEKITDLPEVSGEFIEAYDSKIHRGIYSSRYDLKYLYDQLESIMTYQVEPMSALASTYGISVKQGLINRLWKTIARGQAHDSSGGCNSDKTNQDIHQRGVNALQEAHSLVAYMLRKLSLSLGQKVPNKVYLWNPLPFPIKEVREFQLSTTNSYFDLVDNDGKIIPFDILEQQKENAGILRHNPTEMKNEYYYKSTVACQVEIPAMSWIEYNIEFTREKINNLATKKIETDRYQLEFNQGFNLTVKSTGNQYENFLYFEDGGDEGDTYDYSPAYYDWILNLDFTQAKKVSIQQGKVSSQITVLGSWNLPSNLQSRQQRLTDTTINYQLTLKIKQHSKRIQIKFKVDNHALDHRLRLVFKTDINSDVTYSDTPFGVIKRPVEEIRLKDWQEYGYKEEPTSLRPMIHFANLHNDNSSWTFIGQGTKDFQSIGSNFNQLAITVFRGVGYLGRPDTLRRPGDASGLQTIKVATPDSQLQGNIEFKGELIVDNKFDPVFIQNQYVLMTQDDLIYQIQDLNRFTTPIQYFPMNPCNSLEDKLTHIRLEALQVVFSSFQTTVDQAGLEVRVYNPTNNWIDAPGIINSSQVSDVVSLDLSGKLIKTEKTLTNIFEMSRFGPGEIRTYGIYPQKNQVRDEND